MPICTASANRCWSKLARRSVFLSSLVNLTAFATGNSIINSILLVQYYVVRAIPILYKVLDAVSVFQRVEDFRIFSYINRRRFGSQHLPSSALVFNLSVHLKQEVVERFFLVCKLHDSKWIIQDVR